jgi:hypothetical protein
MSGKNQQTPRAAYDCWLSLVPAQFTAIRFPLEGRKSSAVAGPVSSASHQDRFDHA